jgi:hypothetical protein
LYAQYLIEPRPELAPWLRTRVDPDVADILLEPVVLVNPEGGRTIWTSADHALTVKLVYLASLRQYTPLDSDPGFETALGSPRISLGLFDHWWTLRLLPGSHNTESLRQYVAKHLESVERTGNELVDSWLEWVRDHGGSNAAPSRPPEQQLFELWRRARVRRLVS